MRAFAAPYVRHVRLPAPVGASLLLDRACIGAIHAACHDRGGVRRRMRPPIHGPTCARTRFKHRPIHDRHARIAIGMRGWRRASAAGAGSSRVGYRVARRSNAPAQPSPRRLARAFPGKPGLHNRRVELVLAPFVDHRGTPFGRQEPSVAEHPLDQRRQNADRVDARGRARPPKFRNAARRSARRLNCQCTGREPAFVYEVAKQRYHFDLTNRRRSRRHGGSCLGLWVSYALV